MSIIQPAGGSMALVPGFVQSVVRSGSPQSSLSKTMRLSEHSLPSRLSAWSSLEVCPLSFHAVLCSKSFPILIYTL